MDMIRSESAAGRRVAMLLLGNVGGAAAASDAVTLLSSNDFNPDDTEYMSDLMLADAMVITMSVALICVCTTCIWSVIRCRGGCIPSDASPTRQNTYAAALVIFTVGVVIAAVFIVLYALEIDSERAAVIDSVAPLRSWYPNATGYVDGAVLEYDYTISQRAPLLRDINRTYATYIELNMTRSRNALNEITTRLLLAESGSFQAVMSDRDAEVADLIVSYYIFVGFVTLLTIGSLVNVLVRQYCYPTEFLKENRGVAWSMLVFFGLCAIIFESVIWASLVYQHHAVARNADFCFNFHKSMRTAIQYKYPRQTMLDDGVPIGDRYLNYFMQCAETQEASLFTERYAFLYGNMTAAEDALGLITEQGGLNATQVQAVAETERAIALISRLVGATPGQARFPVDDLGGQISCEPFAGMVGEAEKLMCEHSFDTEATALLIAAIAACVASIGVFVSLRVPVMDVNVHAMPDRRFNSVRSPTPTTETLMNPAFILAANPVNAGFNMPVGAHTLGAGTTGGPDGDNLRRTSIQMRDTVFQPSLPHPGSPEPSGMY